MVQNSTGDEFGRSELHYAAADGDTARVALLLCDGADPHARDAAQFTPLHFAGQEQHADVVQQLVGAGAEVDATDRWGNTPLWRCVFTAHGEVTSAAAVLLAAGADPDAVNRNGVSPRRLGATISTAR